MEEQELVELKELVGDALGCARLTAWELGFVTSMQHRIERYGADTHISEKQEAVLRRIEEKVYQS